MKKEWSSISPSSQNDNLEWIPKKSPLKNGLFARNPLLNKGLTLFNALTPSQKRGDPIPKALKKILVCNIAHFGDGVISTTVLPVLKKHYPECEIGFLASTVVGKEVLKDHPLISRVHFYDHWYLQRSKCKAALHLQDSYRQLLKELVAVEYDLAIDLYPYFPNAIPLLARTKIPYRVGYTSGGFANLLTHPVEWAFHDRYVGWAHLHLLEKLGIDIQGESPLPDYNYKKKRGDYVVLHMGSSSPLKEWKKEGWVELGYRFKALGWDVVLTGKGERELKLSTEVAALTGAKNLCNKLDWKEFVLSVQGAKLLISVDSAAVHIAAGSLTPTVVIYAGMNSPHMWVPPASSCKPLMNPVACAPCFNKRGCPSMSCIQDVGVNAVYQVAIELLRGDLQSVKL